MAGRRLSRRPACFCSLNLPPFEKTRIYQKRKDSMEQKKIIDCARKIVFFSRAASGPDDIIVTKMCVGRRINYHASSPIY